MWAFKQLWDRGLLYEGFRVMPYSWAAQTPVSNFETRMDNSYRERQDPAITVRFTLDGDPELWVWTTTPWTLPSDLALAVGPEIEYALFEKDRRRIALGAATVEVRAELGGAAGRQRAGRCSSARRPHAALPVLREHAERVRGSRRFVRRHRRRHGRRAHGAGLRRGRHGRVSGRWHPGGRARRRGGEVNERGAALGGAARLRREPSDHPRTEGARRDRPPRDDRPQLPALLAHRPAADLPRDELVVREGHRDPRPHGRRQSRHQLGARAHPRRAVRQVARGRARLVDQPQSFLGLAPARVDLGRPALPAHRRVRLARRARARLRRAAR